MTKPLKNLKHEKFARELAKNPKQSQTEAYSKIYNVDDNTAKTSASRLLSNDNVRQRVLDLMSSSAGRPILEKVGDRINDHIDGDNAPVSMDACKTVLKVAGVLDADTTKQEASYNPVQIIIQQMNISSQPITPQPLTD